jgi:hypothetical protein
LDHLLVWIASIVCVDIGVSFRRNPWCYAVRLLPVIVSSLLE